VAGAVRVVAPSYGKSGTKERVCFVGHVTGEVAGKQ